MAATKAVSYPLLPTPLLIPEKRSRVALFFEVFWAVWLGMLVIGDPIANFIFGEKTSTTHFLATHISVSLRVPIISWIAWHFLVVHVKG
jgi:hypothetical protein